MENRTRYILLAVAVIAIVAAIFLIDAAKPPAASASDIPVPTYGQENPGNATGNMTTTPETQLAQARVAAKEGRYARAKELVRPDGFLNTAPFNLSSLVGKKVVLLDVWTYSCINCQRTVPYLEAWYEKYKDDGLVVVGLHAPEFDFEKDPANVAMAVKELGITYPVVLDNEHATWKAYQNRYWPHEYLIGIDGFIVHDHIGEGGYDETEKAIRQALAERKVALGLNTTVPGSMVDVTPTQVTGAVRTAETYFGYAYSRGQLGNDEGWRPNQDVRYAVPAQTVNGRFYLSGLWRNNPDNMEALGNASVVLPYAAKDVYLVAGADAPVEVTVLVDGTETRRVTVGPHDLYTLVQGADYGSHTLELRTPPGLRAYTFTFG